MNPATFLMINVTTDKPEWDSMWDALRSFWRAPDFAEHNDRYGESWQYMGTSLSADTWEHTFRHRAHPRTGKREYYRVLASQSFHERHPIPKDPPPPYAGARPSRNLIPFDPAHCGGAFDGYSVVSDAEGGL